MQVTIHTMFVNEKIITINSQSPFSPYERQGKCILKGVFNKNHSPPHLTPLPPLHWMILKKCKKKHEKSKLHDCSHIYISIIFQLLLIFSFYLGLWIFLPILSKIFKVSLILRLGDLID